MHLSLRLRVFKEAIQCFSLSEVELVCLKRQTYCDALKAAKEPRSVQTVPLL